MKNLLFYFIITLCFIALFVLAGMACSDIQELDFLRLCDKYEVQYVKTDN